MDAYPLSQLELQTTALFYVADKKVSGKESKILFDFIKSYKQNFVQSLLVTVILGVLWFSATIYLMMGYSFLQQGFSLSLFILVVIVFEVMMLSFYMCALLAKYELKTIMLIKNSFYLPMRIYLNRLKHLVSSLRCYFV